ncbi:hypothetical protein HanRHA438_Chr03g0112621 [Helianthus annuus]|nr:hypothetical protein HanHA300_Chr03g0084821 [Helianthus annuus]KAJ0607397.1 hypothetical protein HanHA89_Chr03g0096331 [Helianthus annuus]KAJ0767453.1 hypothetical protein HanLR1_Chr03g0089601 [Helianthus annuus]KAJ0773287.1 hypothetical protein HanOQP8_Chr03g0097551 [Helianthus annuus]KAJ0934878.1 hypothetical protein HanRHA438_Chr03g0112621 [Helianthus annuus]
MMNQAEREIEKQNERDREERERGWRRSGVAAHGGGSGNRWQFRRWLVSRTSGLCLGPAVCVMDRRSLSLSDGYHQFSGGSCLYLTSLAGVVDWLIIAHVFGSSSELSGLRVKSRVQSTQFSLDKVRFGQICPRQKRFGLTRLTQRVDSVNSTESTRSTAASQLSRFGSAGSGQAAWSDGSVRLTRSTQSTFSAFRHENLGIL